VYRLYDYPLSCPFPLTREPQSYTLYQFRARFETVVTGTGSFDGALDRDIVEMNHAPVGHGRTTHQSHPELPLHLSLSQSERRDLSQDPAIVTDPDQGQRFLFLLHDIDGECVGLFIVGIHFGGIERPASTYNGSDKGHDGKCHRELTNRRRGR
jgi:hypothetical protein